VDYPEKESRNWVRVVVSKDSKRILSTPIGICQKYLRAIKKLKIIKS